jgi:hypothetical protein
VLAIARTTAAISASLARAAARNPVMPHIEELVLF